MRAKNRIKILQKIAYVPGDYDVAPTPSKAVSTGFKNLSKEEMGAGLTAIEAALGFVPVVGESIAIYQGAKILVNASSKWDYIWGALLITLGLFGLSHIPGGKQALQRAIVAAKSGNTQLLAAILRVCKLGNKKDVIISKLASHTDINPDRLKSALSTADNNLDIVFSESQSSQGVRNVATEAGAIINTTEQVGSVSIKFIEASSNTVPTALSASQSAKSILESKGLGNLWRGDVVVGDPYSGALACVSPNATYNRISDLVTLSLDAARNLKSSNPLRDLLHEIGHRYWFKFMSQEQRLKYFSTFEVKNVHVGGRFRNLPLYTGSAKTLKEFTSTFLSNLESKIESIIADGNWRDSLSAFLNEQTDILSEERSAANAFFNVLDRVSSEQYNVLSSKVRSELHKLSEPISTSNKTVSWGIDTTSSISASSSIPKEQAVQSLEKIKNYYMEFFNSLTNEERETLEDLFLTRKPATQSIPSTSDYGYSNAEESFAEAFADFMTNASHLTENQIKVFKEIFNLHITKLNFKNVNQLVKVANNYYLNTFNLSIL